MMIDRKDKRFVSCPVCGKILMKCQGQCNVEITCSKCNREIVSILRDIAKVLNTTAGYLMDGDEMGFDADVMQLAMMLQEMKNENVRKVAIEQVKVLAKLNKDT